MGAGFDKQPASRPITYQTISYSTGIAVFSAKFGAATQHIRVVSPVAGWASIDQSTSSTVVTSSTIPAGMFIPASTVGGEYFIVTPGQILTFCSTSTSTGTVSVTEMG